MKLSQSKQNKMKMVIEINVIEVENGNRSVEQAQEEVKRVAASLYAYSESKAQKTLEDLSKQLLDARLESKLLKRMTPDVNKLTWPYK